MKPLVPPDFDAGSTAEADDPIKSFTSWKLRVLNALSMDRRVTHGEFRTAFRLIQHANRKTGAIFPSQDRIADQIGVRGRQVREHIAGLVEKGWLKVSRPNRQLSNMYEFDLQHENAILDRQISLDDVRADRRKTTSQEILTGGKLPLPRGGKPPVARGDFPPVNTLTEHPNGTPQQGIGIEEEESNAAA